MTKEERDSSPIPWLEKVQVMSAGATQTQTDILKRRVMQAQANATVFVSNAKSNTNFQKLADGLDSFQNNIKSQAQIGILNLQQTAQHIDEIPLVRQLVQSNNIENPRKAILKKSMSEPQFKENRVREADMLKRNFSYDADTIKNLRAGYKMALQNCQQQIKQTAEDCQNNFSTLTEQLRCAVSGNLERQKNGGIQGQDSLQLPLDFSFALRTLLSQKGKDVSSIELLEKLATNTLDMPSGPFQKEASRRQRKRNVKSSLKENGRKISIITTAALPWMTGTSINPLLRAAYLANDESYQRKVTLLIPWLSPNDQERVYPAGKRFKTPDSQEEYVREWVEKRTGFKSQFHIGFYPGRFAPDKGSILPVGDLTDWVQDHEADVAVLEEPEHLTWYHHGRRFCQKFNHVVGIMHTNYLDYARREENGEQKARILKFINKWVTGVHCHKVIKLSDAVQDLPRQETMFVHGVSPQFLETGMQMRKAAQESSTPFNKGAYYIAKVLWGKGYTELLDIVEHAQKNGARVPVDVFGNGDDFQEVCKESSRRKIDLQFHGARDHLHESIAGYKVFVNPSTSDVVATTTAEALAMGKWVVVPDLPCNEFFKRAFTNCLTYQNQDEFSEKLQQALKHDPKPLSQQEHDILTWEAATKRFIDQADITHKHKPNWADNIGAITHNIITGWEPARQFMGAGANTLSTPQRLIDFEPEKSVFDKKKRVKTAR